MAASGRCHSETLCLSTLAGLLLVALAGAAGCGRPSAPLRSDPDLIAFFHAHRVDLDSLRDNYQAALRYGPHDRDPALTQQWIRLLRRLGLPGGGALEDTRRIIIQAGGRRLSRNLIDWKGFAWLDSIMPRGVVFDTLTDLDALDEQALRKPGRHIRHLDGHWWLYRWIGEPARD